MKVLLIMLLAAIGTAAMIVLCGAARWSFIYLIRCRFLKRESTQERYALTRRNDIVAGVIAIITLIVTVLLLAYGLPFVIDNISKLPFNDTP